MRVLVTGAAGFAGSHLIDALLDRGDTDIYATDRVPSPPPNLAHCIDRIRYTEAELEETDTIGALLEAFRPERIFHLAGQAFVPAYEHAWSTAALDALGATLNFYEMCRTRVPESRVVLISSAEVYGRSFISADGPVDETAVAQPLNVYGGTKLSLEHFAGVVHSQHGMDMVILRPFNHIGPRQSPQFVCASFAKQIAQIESGAGEPVIHVGNLDSERDFTDVRDMVRAYILAAERCDPGVPYNICSGKAVSIRSVLETYLELTDVEFETVSETELQRTYEIRRVYGSSQRFRQCTGWVAAYTLEQTIKDTLEYWRGRVVEDARE